MGLQKTAAHLKIGPSAVLPEELQRDSAGGLHGLGSKGRACLFVKSDALDLGDGGVVRPHHIVRQGGARDPSLDARGIELGHAYPHAVPFAAALHRLPEHLDRLDLQAPMQMSAQVNLLIHFTFYFTLVIMYAHYNSSYSKKNFVVGIDLVYFDTK